MNKRQNYLFIWEIILFTATALWDVPTSYKIQLVYLFEYVVAQGKSAASDILWEPRDCSLPLQHTMRHKIKLVQIKSIQLAHT